MRKGNRLSLAQSRAARDALDALWGTFYVHAVTEEVIQAAAQAALDHALRAYDALHLAAALAFAEGEKVVFACWDRELSDAAKKHGFALLPERL